MLNVYQYQYWRTLICAPTDRHEQAALNTPTNMCRGPWRPRAFLNGQKLVKTNTSPMRYQPLMRTATDWVSCVLCALVTLGSGLP